MSDRPRSRGWLMRTLERRTVCLVLVCAVAADAWFAADDLAPEGETVVGSIMRRWAHGKDRLASPTPGWMVQQWSGATTAVAEKRPDGSIDVTPADRVSSMGEWIVDTAHAPDGAAVIALREERRAWGLWRYWLRTRRISIDVTPVRGVSVWNEADSAEARRVFVERVLTIRHLRADPSDLAARDVRLVDVRPWGVAHDLFATALLAAAVVSVGLNTLALVRATVLRRASRLARGLCVACGYDLSGIESGVCPECGREAEPLTRSPGAARSSPSSPRGLRSRTGSRTPPPPRRSPRS